MAKWLKHGISEEQAVQDNTRVREIVESILAEIAERGDAAVREYSEKFDQWSPESYRLSDEQIQACIDSLPESTLDDIRFAQAQVRNFAHLPRIMARNDELARFQLPAHEITASWAAKISSHPILARRRRRSNCSSS